MQAAKPDPAMFLRAMTQAGASPAHTLHVGDHPIHDIRGARNAGIDAVWVNRFNRVWDEREAEPENKFSDLYQLNDWLAS